MIEFKQRRHHTRNHDVIEVFVNGEFTAAIYPQDDDSLTITSKHFNAAPSPVVQTLALDEVKMWQFRFKKQVKRDRG